MYIPPAFNEDRIPVLHAAIQQAGLANLVTLGPDGLIASPIPLMLDPAAGPYGTLHGHIARANPQRHANADTEALAIFMGPDAYITPSYYETKRETGKVVPTWNYVTIHAYGPITFSDDTEALMRIVTRLTDRHETARPAPWKVSDAPPSFTAAQLKGILAFQIPITRLQGKWKMSQNRTQADQAGVVAGLQADDQPHVAGLVAAGVRPTPA